MHLDEPSWWYGDKPSGIATCLKPAAAIYGRVAKARYRRRKPFDSRLPVVCIGNFTVGGTGKTPLAIYLCEHLRAIGHEPVVLTRGYGGRLSGPYWVNSQSDIARDVGDEALLLSRVGSTVVAHDREAGARAIESGPYPVSVIIMDDGLQNPGMKKDLAIAVVDGARGLGNRLVMPAGPLRAPLDFQLELTDAIIVNDPPGTSGSYIADYLRRHFNGPVLRAATVAAEDTEWLEDRRVVAWAGIGSPQRFFKTLEEYKAVVMESVAFRDHQALTDADAERLLDLADKCEATLLTTEKDMARLVGSTGMLELLHDRSRVLPVKLQFAENDTERLSALLDTALKEQRR